MRVLIADDAKETRDSIELLLSLVDNAEVVAVAANGREAVELARLHYPDIALVDINMPEMDGLTAIQTMRKSQPDLVCIVISAEKDSPTMKRAVQVGARGYLIKPFTSEQILSVMERAAQWVKTKRETQPVAAPPAPPPDLEALAETCIQQCRVDDESMQLFEQLTAQRTASLRWFMALAVVYVVRREWGKLRALAAHLEQRDGR